MALSDAQRAACAAMEDTWYWQVQERGKWRYRWHNEVMVRYYECAPLEADVFAAMIEYLQGQTGITAIQLHGKRIELDGEWKAVRAWYETRDGDTSETNKLKRVRICQALVKSTEETGGEGPYTVENGCMYKVEHTFHWNTDSLPVVPASSSGVNYQIQAVTRDDETGLWNCVVERRERVRQDVAEYTTEKTVFETRKEEQHLGVKQESVASAGKNASVGGGKMIKRKITKNEDCTSNVVNETVQEEEARGAVTETDVQLGGTVETTINRNMPSKASESGLEIGETVRNEKTPGGLWNQTIRKVKAAAAGMVRFVCGKTVFRHTHTKVTNVKDNPGESHVEQAGGGVIREKEVQRTDKGTYDVTERETTDIPVPETITETSKLLDGTVRRTVNRNMPSKASENDLDIGDRVTNEKTESGLWNQTIEKATPTPTGKIEETCEQTALMHTHAETEGVGGGTMPAAETPNGGNGIVKVRRVRKTERGAWNVTDETRTAKPLERKLPQTGSEKRKVETTVLRNKTVLPEAATGKNIESEVSGSVNEFGLLDGTVRTVTHSEAKQKAKGGAESRTVEVESAINSEEPPDEEASEANVETEVSVSPNEHGTASWMKRTTRYKETKCETKSGGPLVEVKREVAANAEEKPEDDYDENAEGEITEISAAKNQHKSYDYTKVKRKCHDKDKLVKWETDDGTKLDTHFVYVFRNKKIEEVPDLDDVKDAGADFGDSGKPVSASMSVSINEFGTVDGVISGIAKREAGGKSGGSDEQGKMSGKKETVIRIWQRNGVPTKYVFELTYDSFWGGSGAWLEKKRAEVANSNGSDCRGYPELGCKSGYYGSVMRVYRSCKLVETGAVTQGTKF